MDVDKVCVLMRRADMGESEGAAVLSSWCRRTGRPVTPHMVKRCNLPLYMFPEVVEASRASGVSLHALIEAGFCKERTFTMDNTKNLDACLRHYGTDELCSVIWNDLTVRVRRSDVTQALSMRGKTVTIAQYLDLCTSMHDTIFEGVQATPYLDVLYRGSTRQEVLGAFLERRLSCSGGVLVPLMRSMGHEPTLDDVMAVAAFANRVNSFIYTACTSLNVAVTTEALLRHGAPARVLVQHMIMNACPEVWGLTRGRAVRGFDWVDLLPNGQMEGDQYFGGGVGEGTTFRRDSYICGAKLAVWKVQHAARKIRRRNAAVKIQRRLRHAIASPYSAMGRRRILREFSGLSDEV